MPLQPPPTACRAFQQRRCRESVPAAQLLGKTTLPPAKLFLAPLLQPPPPCLSPIRPAEQLLRPPAIPAAAVAGDAVSDPKSR